MLSSAFRAYDPSNSGSVTKVEFNKCLSSFGIKGGVDALSKKFAINGQPDRVAYKDFLQFFQKSSGGGKGSNASKSSLKTTNSAIGESCHTLPQQEKPTASKATTNRTSADSALRAQLSPSEEAPAQAYRERVRLGLKLRAADYAGTGMVNLDTFSKELRSVGIDPSSPALEPFVRLSTDPTARSVDYAAFLASVQESAPTLTRAGPARLTPGGRRLCHPDESRKSPMAKAAEDPLAAVSRRMHGRFQDVFESFHLADPTKDGYVDRSDFVKALKRVNAVGSDREAHQLLSQAPTSAEDGRVDYVNFMIGLESAGGKLSSKHVLQPELAPQLDQPSRATIRQTTDKSGKPVVNKHLHDTDIFHQLEGGDSASQDGDGDRCEVSSKSRKQYVSQKDFVTSEANILSWKAKTKHLTATEAALEEIKTKIREKVYSRHSKVRDVFRQFDEDHNGAVDYREFRSGLKNMGVALRDDQFELLLKEVDRDGSGTIDYHEFTESLQTQESLEMPTNLLREEEKVFYGGRKAGSDAKAFKQQSDIFKPDTPAPEERLSGKKLNMFKMVSSEDNPFGVAEQIKERVYDRALGELILSRSGRDVDRLKGAFEAFDANGDGVVSYDEFKTGLAGLGVKLTDEKFEHLVKRADADGNGSIDYNEFVHSMRLDEMSGKIDEFAHLYASQGPNAARTRLKGAQNEWKNTLTLLSQAVPPDQLEGTGHYDIASVGGHLIAKAHKKNANDQQVEKDPRKAAAADLTLTQQRDLALRTKILRHLRTRGGGVAALGETFKSMDLNGDGTLSADEFKKGLDKLGMQLTQPEAERLVRTLSADPNGTSVSYKQFVESIISPKLPSAQGESTTSDYAASETSSVAGSTTRAGSSSPPRQRPLFYSKEDLALKRKLRDKLGSNGATLRDLFSSMSTDSSGHVDHYTLRSSLSEMGAHLSDQEFGKLVDKMDPARTGRVAFAHLVSALGDEPKTPSRALSVGPSARDEPSSESQPKPRESSSVSMLLTPTAEELKEQQVKEKVAHGVKGKLADLVSAFKAFDQERDGVVTLPQFRAGLQYMGVQLSEDDVKHTAAIFDTSKDGTIDYEAFTDHFAKSNGETLERPAPRQTERRPQSAPVERRRAAMLRQQQGEPESGGDVSMTTTREGDRTDPRESPAQSSFDSVRTPASPRRGVAAQSHVDSEDARSVVSSDSAAARKSVQSDVISKVVKKELLSAVHGKAGQIREAFRALDRGRTCQLSAAEFRRALKGIDATMPDWMADRAVRLAQTYSSGACDYERFLSATGINDGLFDDVDKFRMGAMESRPRHNLDSTAAKLAIDEHASSHLAQLELTASADDAVSESGSVRSSLLDFGPKSAIAVRDGSPGRFAYRTIDSGDILAHSSPVRESELRLSRSPVPSARKGSGNLLAYVGDDEVIQARMEGRAVSPTSDQPPARRMLRAPATVQATTDFDSRRIKQIRVDPSVAERVLKKTRGRMNQFLEAFRLSDESGDGTVSPRAFETNLREFGVLIPDDQVVNLLKQYDVGDGKIKYAEFVQETKEAVAQSVAMNVTGAPVRVAPKEKYDPITHQDSRTEQHMFTFKKRVAAAPKDDNFMQQQERHVPVRQVGIPRSSSPNPITHAAETPTQEKQLMLSKRRVATPQPQPPADIFNKTATPPPGSRSPATGADQPQDAEPKSPRWERSKPSAEVELRMKVADKLHQHSGKTRLMWRALDIDGDGKVSAADLQSGLKRMNVELTKHQANQVARMCGTDARGMVDFNSFNAAFGNSSYEGPVASTPSPRSSSPPARSSSLSRLYDRRNLSTLSLKLDEAPASTSPCPSPSSISVSERFRSPRGARKNQSSDLLAWRDSAEDNIPTRSRSPR